MQKCPNWSILRYLQLTQNYVYVHVVHIEKKELYCKNRHTISRLPVWPIFSSNLKRNISRRQKNCLLSTQGKIIFVKNPPKSHYNSFMILFNFCWFFMWFWRIFYKNSFASPASSECSLGILRLLESDIIEHSKSVWLIMT